jgi:glycine oxidase
VNKAPSLLVLGGGVLGLGCAWAQARQGWQVTVLERDRCGHGASWAAAGMFAPQSEMVPGEEDLLPLLLESRSLWPDFAALLEEESGHPIHFRREGTLTVAAGHDEHRMLQDRAAYLEQAGCSLAWLSAAEARQKEPFLSRQITAALYSPDDGQVDNRALVTALIAACQQKGVCLREQTNVARLKPDGCVLENGEFLVADKVLVSVGSWAEKLVGLPSLGIRPVKGQMLMLKMKAERPLLRHVVWGDGVYLVPRSDGRLLIGATVEEKGFDTTITAGALRDLLRRAFTILPGIDELPLLETWAGLRPGSMNGLPIVGASSLEGVAVALGHYRNGILLLPWTVQRITDHLTASLLTN